ncbi:hypothetical protein QBC38DRAFT_375687 [Podospora fimiseda]|uniref:Uncharacterized protein n=1 Tax=Podospora fimiseda TaxID=252190 RepID=A0AAN6YN46_9PEZI|nr:hypothetical protein QBC38DRAFT_375687 [Podospora fimiseda]
MSPPCQSFHPSKLPLHVQVGPDHRVRKVDNTQDKQIDLLRDCALKSLVQYECVVTRPEKRNSPVKCYPIERLFRQCEDKKGKFMVETTSWEAEVGGRNNNNPNPDGVISHVLEEERHKQEFRERERHF